MRSLIATLLFAVTVFGQDAPAPAPAVPAPAAQVPAQGPPPTNLTKFPDGHFSANSEPTNSENFEVHIVVKGDTLSGIALNVLKDAKLWPQIWEQNEHIVNPHWIYPSDKILIRPITRISEATPPATEEAAAATETAEAAPAVAENVTPSQQQTDRPRLVVAPATAPAPAPGPTSFFNLTPPRSYPEVKAADLYCSGFIRDTTVSGGARVIGRYTGDQQLMAGQGDYVYVGRGADDGIRPGTTYQVLRPTRPVSSPRGGTLGMHYLEVALVDIVLSQSNYSLARVTRGCNAVEVGDLLVDYTPTEFPSLPARRTFSASLKGSGQAPGTIVMTKSKLESTGSYFSHTKSIPGNPGGPLGLLQGGLAGNSNVVYIDVGRDAGVEPGDLFVVFRDVELRDGELVDRQTGEKAKTAIGEVVVLKVEDRASTALVTYSTDAIARGDSVERR